MTNKEIGEKIRTMRLSRGMTQEELADAIDVSPSAIAMYEAGRRRPKEDVAEALADTFNVPKWSIYYRENEIIIVDTPQEDLRDLGSDARAVQQHPAQSPGLSDIEFALYGVTHELSENGKMDLLQFARFIHEQETKAKAAHDD